MNRLWVRISLAITGILMVGIILLMSTMIILRNTGLIPPGPEDSPMFTPAIIALRQAGIIAPDVTNDEINNAFKTAIEENYEFALEIIFSTLLRVAFAFGIIGIITGMWVSRTLTGPIDKLAEAAQVIGAGNLDHRVSVGGSQEIIDLAEMFNAMASNLQQAETLRNNLMADVSHELRTPLTVLEGNLRAALDHVYDLDEAEIANLYGQTRHLIRLVNDLRELAQAEAHQLPLHKENINLPELVDEVMMVFEPLAEEDEIDLVASAEEHLPQIEIDADRIRQVLHNLMANALRYTSAGGQITIRCAADAKSVRISVADTGEGILAEQLPHVFDRFYRVDSSRTRETGGTGLGLAIVKALIEEHNGEVTVDSPGSGRGSTFTICLPIDTANRK